MSMMLPSRTAPYICLFRRGHDSAGEKQFISEWLIPMLNRVTPEKSVSVDGYGNILVELGNPELLFVAHLDTVHGKNEPADQSVIIADGILSLDLQKSPDATCLGADDASGISVMMYLISKGVKANYLFTRCEERGGHGASYFRANSEGILRQAKIAIEIDRRDFTDAIHTQFVGECASLEFTKSLIKALKMPSITPSDEGSYTDIATFADIIPECVNLPAGYFAAHSKNEFVNLNFLDNLAKALEKVDWAELTIHREAGDFGDFSGFMHGYGVQLSEDAVFKLVDKDPYLAAQLLFDLGITTEDVLIAEENLYGYVTDCSSAV